jgi:RecA/RadA recombinase
MAMVSSAQLRSRVTYSGEWSLPQVAGRFAEISGSKATAALTLAFGLVLDAQKRGEPVGWATSTESSFYPPDAAQLGVDLAALVVVRVPKADAIARAGEKLLRSGGFGLVVLDLGPADIPTPLQSRLTGIAHHHHSALVLPKRIAKDFRLGRSCRYEFMLNERGSAKTSLLAAYRSSKTNGEDRPGRMRNYCMDRRDCIDFVRCLGEP